MKLELKHLAPYLPYKLKGMFGVFEDTLTTIDADAMVVSNANRQNYFIHGFKPILRPLAEFDKLHDINEGSMYAITFNVHKLSVDRDLDIDIEDYSERSKYLPLMDCYETLEVLFKNHFDVFGLIAAGLAIDINTL